MRCKPRISIITPSFNQGQYIEETIVSVIEQNYSNLEYIIIDGGSTDNTLDVIKKYEKYIHYWVSEKDKGQSDAINKGLKKASGDIINWLNSDDYYMPGALHHVASIFSSPVISAYSGRSRIFSGTSEYFSQGTDIYENNLAKTIGWARIDQPETFFRRQVWDTLVEVNRGFHYVMDKELWIRYLLHYGLKGIAKDDKVLVNFRIHEQSKTGSFTKRFRQETVALFHSIAETKRLPIVSHFSMLCKDFKKEIFGYNEAPVDLIERSVHYFLLHHALEAYAENNYQLAKETASLIDLRFIEKDDIDVLKHVLFRMKILPIPIKKLLNKVRTI